MARTERLGLLLAALAACDPGVAPGAPRPAALVPSRGFATVETVVEISGDDFHVEPVQRVDGGGSRVDASFRAWLGETELAAVTWIDARTLRARVPAGLALGFHDLAVEGPYGRGSLAGAYEVIAGEPGALDAALSAPVEVALGEELQIAVRAKNSGSWLVEGVLPEVATSGVGAVEPIAVTVVPEDAPVGWAGDFVLRYRATRPGAVTFAVSVEGIDPRTGGSVSATASAEVVITPALRAEVIAADPFFDGGPFAFVVAYGGEVVVGPSRTGSGIVRMRPDGTFAESLALSFPKDSTGGNQSSNTAAPPYASIGFTGCQTNSASGCGPDNEDGRGFLASATFAGDEWLVVGGARSGGDLDYVYMTRDTSSPLPFSFVDLSAALGGNTRGFSAMRAAGGRLYLGFPDNGGNRPYGVALLTAPPPLAGLDAVAGIDVVDLNLHDAYNAKYVNGTEGGSFATISMVDAIAELGGRVYFFSDLGCLVSTGASPMTKDDFLACSPAVGGAAYVQAESIEPTRQYDLEPRDRAWPATAIWNGRLYAIRNTSTGPQLWACDPAGGADPGICDRTDWTLVAADASSRTRFGEPDAARATLLVATPTHLYVGLDDAVRGVHLFRTAVPAPALASDFSGQDGCVAGTAGCEGIGGDGFGRGAALSRIFDASAIPSGDGVALVVATGDGAAAVTIVRVAP